MRIQLEAIWLQTILGKSVWHSLNCILHVTHDYNLGGNNHSCTVQNKLEIKLDTGKAVSSFCMTLSKHFKQQKHPPKILWKSQNITCLLYNTGAQPKKKKKKTPTVAKENAPLAPVTRSVANSKISIMNRDLCRINASLVVSVVYNLKKYTAELSTTFISNMGKTMVARYPAEGKFVANMETKCKAPISCN